MQRLQTPQSCLIWQDFFKYDVCVCGRAFLLNRKLYFEYKRSDRSLPPLSKGPGENYYHIALHYRFALQRLFALPERYEGVIILEEDIDIAPDTLAYFRAMRRVMLRDPTIWTVSAWNDNGGIMLLLCCLRKKKRRFVSVHVSNALSSL